MEYQDDDLVADFLKREQGELAGLQDNFEHADNFYDEEYNAQQGYGTIIANAGNDFIDTQSKLEPLDNYSAIKNVDKERLEPEKIRKWREEQVERLAKKDAESEKKKQEWREIARKELEDWHKHREELLSKTMTSNRDSEESFAKERDEKKPGGEWERVCRLCDFNPKASRNAKDVSRMRTILLQLKQNGPVVEKVF